VNRNERMRRWQLALGGDDQSSLSERDQRLSLALSALYNAPSQGK